MNAHGLCVCQIHHIFICQCCQRMSARSKTHTLSYLLQRWKKILNKNLSSCWSICEDSLQLVVSYNTYIRGKKRTFADINTCRFSFHRKIANKPNESKSYGEHKQNLARSCKKRESEKESERKEKENIDSAGNSAVVISKSILFVCWFLVWRIYIFRQHVAIL